MIAKVDWEKVAGLVPAIIQDGNDGRVLMLGYMNQEALEKTIQEKRVTFYSRSKKRLWTKGETSGHFLNVKEISLDCDQDALLITVEPVELVCHLHTPSCFAHSFIPFLSELSQVIDQRIQNGGDESYVKRLAAKGISRVAQKVGEEGVETALASACGDRTAIREESADLLFHLLINLRVHKIAWEEIIATLRGRT